MFFFIFFDISSLLLRYITPAIPRSSRLDLSKNILKNIDSYLNFRTLADSFGIELPYDVPKENCMAIELVENGLDGVSGMVEYPKEFNE